MGKGASTREVILRAAVEAACLNGFNGLNLKPLADRVGLTKSGLYAHFGSKAELQLATLEHAAELFQRHVLAPAKTEPPGFPRLAGVFRRWLEWPAQAGLPGNCPFLAGAFELDSGEGALRERLVRLFGEFRQILEQLAAAALRRGQLRASTAPAEVAHELIALRYAHDWAAGLMREPGARERTAAAVDALAAQRP